MRRVVLHGALRQRYGHELRLDIATPAEAIRALSANYRDFTPFVRDKHFKIVVGDKKTGMALSPHELGLRGRQDIHIIPQLRGAKGGGGKIILGGILLIAAFAFAPAVVGPLGPTQGLGTTVFSVFGQDITFGSIARMGLSMAVSGVANALSPQPKADNNGFNAPDERASFLINQPVNSVAQGNPVPVVYGQVKVGSIVVSGNIETTQITT